MLPGSPAIVAGCDDPRGILCQYVKDNSTGTQGLEGKPYPRPRDWKYSGGQIKVFDGRILRTCRHIVDGGNGIGSAIDVLKTGKLQGSQSGTRTAPNFTTPSVYWDVDAFARKG
ncbi:hypothetical protein CGGC5_v012790 [Colletotrichum fructicola Nara gc5]|uniref:Uncharacterized protein n=1 Tax=Colletotrichum fructicola (strain Nara gc5) TaxID=1213859 RepID=A0A7J6IT57_COLFN|nr:hypothetical protein CGGC5_v012790 [Colletotrichum fructicola Nara gc5]